MIGVRVSIWVTVRFRSEICKLHVRSFEIVPHILQLAQIYKSRANPTSTLMRFCFS